MQIGTQLEAPEGFEGLSKNIIYCLLRSDPHRRRVLLVEFLCPSAKDATQQLRSKKAYRTTLHFLSRNKFENALEAKQILVCEMQQELPPWFEGMTIADLRVYASSGQRKKSNHTQRIQRSISHILPLVDNLEQVLSADMPDSLINAHARSCEPKQNETRFRTMFYAYICFGFNPLVLHYTVHNIGRWERIGRPRKFGRPSRLKGMHHGYGSNDVEMIEKIIQGYRKYAGPGQHMNKIYRRTMQKVFGCAVQSDPVGKKYFIHPTGQAFPTFGQFAYRVAQEFPLEVRQIYKYGQSRVRNSLAHSMGRFTDNVGNLMERVELDAYCCAEVARGYLPGSHLPPLWVVRTRCIASGMIVGIGFSVGSETAAAYRMAKFCEAIGKVKFCSLFGLSIVDDDWPSIGVSPHIVYDRGPGISVEAEALHSQYLPVIKEFAPSYSGQSKASIETTHPKQVRLDGKPHFIESSLSLTQLAAQEVMRAVADNNSIDVSDRLNNDAVIEQVLPTAVYLWRYLAKKGRTHAASMSFEEAVRQYLAPIELTVMDDAVYFKGVRFASQALQQTSLLQVAHGTGTYEIKGYMLDVCMRHLWVESDIGLIEVDAMLAIRDGNEQLYISVLELEQLEKLRRDAKLELSHHRLAARSQYEESFETYSGQAFDAGNLKAGRNKRSKAVSIEERQEIMAYVRAGKRGAK